MNLNRKHYEIINLIIQNSVPIEKISFLLNISEKTINTYIKQINHYFEGSYIIYKTQNYLNSNLIDEIKFQKSFRDLKESINLSQNENFELITNVFDLILNNFPIQIDDISEHLYISKSSTNNILNELRRILEDYDIELIGKPNVGLYLSGSEYSIRKIIVEKFSSLLIHKKLSDQIVMEINKLNEKLKLDKDSYQRFIDSIKITISRIEDNHLITNKIMLEDSYIYDSQEYKDVKFIRNHIYQINNDIDINSEMLLIIIQLIGRRASILNELLSSKDETLIENILVHTLLDVKNYYEIEINKNIFSKDIRLHIKHLLNRLIFDVKLTSSLKFDIDEKYPFAYELSKVLGENISKFTNLHVPKSELSLLTIYFSVYLESLEHQLNDISKIAILTDEGLSIFKLIKKNLIHIFGINTQIDKIEKNDINNSLLNQYELLITTSKKATKYNKVIYLDNPFDEKLLKSKIEQFLIFKDYINNAISSKPLINSLIKQKDFYHFQENLSYKDYLNFLSDELIKENNVDFNFKQRIIERENVNSTVNNLLGFPHASHDFTDINIKVAILDNSCNDYKNLKIIILIAIPQSMSNEYILIRLYEEILGISSNKFLLNQINEETSFNDFTKLINQEMGSS